MYDVLNLNYSLFKVITTPLWIVKLFNFQVFSITYKLSRQQLDRSNLDIRRSIEITWVGFISYYLKRLCCCIALNLLNYKFWWKHKSGYRRVSWLTASHTRIKLFFFFIKTSFGVENSAIGSLCLPSCVWDKRDTVFFLS